MEMQKLLQSLANRMRLGDDMEEMTTRDLIQVRRMASTGAAKAIRQAAGVSLSEVAADVGVTRSCVHRWERGDRRPRGDAALRYLHLLEELSGVRA